MADNFAARVRWQELRTQHGLSIPLGEPRVGKPLIIGHCPEQCRLLRLWPHADGWHVLIDGGRIPAADYRAIVSAKREAVEGNHNWGDSWPERKLRDNAVVLVRQPEEWRSGSVICGCRHGAGLAAIEPIAATLTAMLDKRRKPSSARVPLRVIRASAC